MKDDDQFIELLLKEADHRITNAEKQALETWLALSSRNQKIAKQVRQAWYESGQIPDRVPLDLEAEYSMVQDKIRKSDRPVRIRYWLAAAVVLFLTGSVVISFYLWNLNPKERELLSGPLERTSLEDGSLVWLTAGSTLQIKSLSRSRQVALTGRGYFEVQSDPDRPFEVATTLGQVQALGTSFEIEAAPLQLSVTLSEGQIIVTDLNQKSITLLPGEKGIITSTRLEKEKSGRPAGSWRLQTITYQQSELQEILREIESKYLVTFSAENPEILRCRINLTLDYPEIRELISILETLLDIRIDQTGESQYNVTGQGC